MPVLGDGDRVSDGGGGCSHQHLFDECPEHFPDCFLIGCLQVGVSLPDIGPYPPFVEVRIPFKDNTRPPSNDASEWSKNLRYFQQNYEQFMSEYHPRSNVESTDSSVKRVLPEQLRAKGFDGQTNEALVKLIAYNLRVLAREVWMRDIPLDLPSEVLALEDCIRQVVDMRGHGSQGQAA